MKNITLWIVVEDNFKIEGKVIQVAQDTSDDEIENMCLEWYQENVMYEWEEKQE